MENNTVLIVDDDPHILRAIHRVLRREPCRVLTAGSAARGLACLAKEDVQIVISDKNMPRTDGLVFLMQVKSEFPRVLTIMLTGNADLGSAMEAINVAGVFKYLLKPWDDDDLRFTVREALAFIHRQRTGIASVNDAKSNDIVRRDLEKEFPGITHVVRDKDGYIIS
jgi:DNA-binding NtrC family response regulator